MWKLWKTPAQPAESEVLRRLDALEEQLREQEARTKVLETEWASVYQKIRKAVGHITKTAALEAPKPEPQPTNGVRPRNLDQLSREEIAQLPLP